MAINTFHASNLSDNARAALGLAPKEPAPRARLHYDLRSYEENLAAEDAVTALIAAAKKFLREFDAEVANNEGENPLTDPGCVVCTDGTTPHDRDTGPCGYHALSAALDKVSP